MFILDSDMPWSWYFLQSLQQFPDNKLILVLESNMEVFNLIFNTALHTVRYEQVDFGYKRGCDAANIKILLLPGYMLDEMIKFPSWTTATCPGSPEVSLCTRCGGLNRPATWTPT